MRDYRCPAGTAVVVSGDPTVSRGGGEAMTALGINKGPAEDGKGLIPRSQ